MATRPETQQVISMPDKIPTGNNPAARRAFHKFHGSRGDERKRAAVDFAKAIGTDTRQGIEILHGEALTRFTD
jgi:hypothetical protein